MKFVKLLPITAFIFALSLGTAHAEKTGQHTVNQDQTQPLKEQLKEAKADNKTNMKIKDNWKDAKAKKSEINASILELNKILEDNRAKCAKTKSSCNCTEDKLSPFLLIQKKDDQTGTTMGLDMAYPAPENC